jgi:hypothetical protein
MVMMYLLMISCSTIPKSCNTVASFPIVVDGSKAFSAKYYRF